MPDSDQPPERIWLDDEALAAHFEATRERYRQGATGMESVPQASELEQNELTKGLR